MISATKNEFAPLNTTIKPVNTHAPSAKVLNNAAQDLQDSPRTHTGDVTKRKSAPKAARNLSTTLRAQKQAGKNDSAEMYSAALAPKLQSPVASPKASCIAAKSLKPPTLARSESLDSLIVSSDDDDSTLNTGWNEWGIDASSDDESHKPAAKTTSRNTAAKNDSAHESDEDVTAFHLGNEWALSDSDDEA